MSKAEALLTALGIDRVAYLLVPDYHHTHPIEADDAFVEWCRRSRPFLVDWVLHGYHHVEDPPSLRTRPRLSHWIARQTMTASEGEFLALEPGQLRERLISGRRAVTAATGVSPQAFVAPAWLFNDRLLPVLSELDFRYTEDHWRVIDVRRGQTHRCPVITWATRTAVRRIGSRAICPASLRLFRRAPALRIAIHPFDMDHPKTVDQIRRVLTAALELRRPAGYDELFLDG